MKPGALDLHLIAEGRHEELWKVLGAHPGPDGTDFAVWAPNALEVQVVGDFNNWDGSRLPLHQIGSGVWHGASPEAGQWSTYKFRIRGADGVWRDKADPLAFHAQTPPETASRVFESSHLWGDEDWMSSRPAHLNDRPMAIYEVHLGSWRRGLDYRGLANELVGYVRDLGFTHVELMPVMQHPFGGSWGYHVTSYFAPDSRFGSPDDLRLLIDSFHQAGIGVILDWVPGHFATDDWALANFDGTGLYEDPRGMHPEWGSYEFHLSRWEVRNFLVANANYWLSEFHADGLRVDGVASMLYLDYGRNDGEWQPNMFGGRENLDAVQFLQELNATVYKLHPGISVIAEESTSWPGVTRPTDHDGLGFGFKWNMGWMHDTLDYLHRDPIHRRFHHHELTFSLTYQWSENFVLPISHDEVVHGKGSLLRKMPGDRWQQLANLRAALGFMWAHPGKKLLFMGCEFGQESEWAESRELDWWLLDHPEHRGMADLMRRLNQIYSDADALWALDGSPDGFSWIDADDADRSTYSFVRRGNGEQMVCVTNLAGIPHSNFELRLPSDGVWDEVLNTDAHEYGGSGVGNLGSVTAVDGRATIVVPPLATLWLRPAAKSATQLDGTLEPVRAAAIEPVASPVEPVEPVASPVETAGRVEVVE
ncbi:1,4-alpha-glucan branching protein GlgB [soil metagenome]